jgi:hypothetical protein
VESIAELKDMKLLNSSLKELNNIKYSKNIINKICSTHCQS